MAIKLKAERRSYLSAFNKGVAISMIYRIIYFLIGPRGIAIINGFVKYQYYWVPLLGLWIFSIRYLIYRQNKLSEKTKVWLKRYVEAVEKYNFEVVIQDWSKEFSINPMWITNKSDLWYKKASREEIASKIGLTEEVVSSLFI